MSHGIAEELAAHAGVPVWNGLTDDHHPTQALADLMTQREEFGRLSGLSVAYVGDGRNNMVTSLAIAALKTGLDLRGRLTITADVEEGVAGCQAVYTDVWVSMGETEIARAHPDLCEIEDAVFEGARSRVFPQAENRMHSIKALMVETI